MQTTHRGGLAWALGLALGTGFIGAPPLARAVHAAPLRNNVLNRAVMIHKGQIRRPLHQQKLSAGLLYAAMQASGELDRRAKASTVESLMPPISPGSQGCRNTFSRNPLVNSSFDNVRVNQDCSLRRQAEEVIAVNPKDQLNLIGGMNDSRIGFNHCAYAWSFDGGRTWGDLIPPFFGFQLDDGHSADFCADPTAVFDADGNGYAGGILFDENSPATAVVVTKSNAGIGGAFYHSPLVQPFQTFSTTPVGIVASDADPNVIHDKDLMTADANASSPKKNNVYMVWTRFDLNTGAGVGFHTPIHFSQSTDGGATWSPGVEISGTNPALCTVVSGEADPNACDQDQGGHPIVAPDGTVYVAFGNGNTPLDGINQHLIVSCPPAADCSQQASWTAPAKITDDIGLQPLGPDANTGCDADEQCLPPNGYRLDDFTTGSLSVDKNGKLYFVWSDFRNGVSGPCNPADGLASSASSPCDNDVLYAFSTNGGATWSAAKNLTPASRFGVTAQWQPWSAVARNGNFLWVAYYDRSYGKCESTGCNDITLVRVTNPASTTPSLRYNRLTTASMPNLLPSNNPLQAGFLGDYMWVTTNFLGDAFVVWADTRGLDGRVEEDVYFANVGR